MSRQRLAPRLLPALLFLAALPAGWAQAPGGLQITVIEGQGVQHATNSTAAAPIVVELRDAAGAPIPRAEVTFKSPSEGPSATFFGASNISKAWTDENGRAQTTSLTPNTVPGPFTILVEANHQGASASAEIQQTNAAPAAPEKKKRRFSKRIWIPVVVGVVAVVVGLAQRD